MRVAKLELTGVGPFEGAVFEIPEPPEGMKGELVFFEGPNGCGKTTIAEAIACTLYSLGWGDAPREQFERRFRGQGNGVIRFERGDWWRVLRWGRTRAGGGWDSSDGTMGSATLAFAYAGHQPTPVVATKGPTEIQTHPLSGALSFGTVAPESAYFGQYVVNLDQEVAKAFREARREGVSPERREQMDRMAASRQHMLDEIVRALSEVIRRKVTFDVPVGEHMPTVFVDGEAIPLDLLGEGMRSTFAWLSDLLVRLHRIPWEDTTRSPLEQDFWLILDEIDESLHPTMQAHLYPALRALFPNARIYATTHSPFVVASAAEGVVFPIRPGKDHKVRGNVEARKLEPGQTLEWVTTEIFQAHDGFVDQKTRDMLDAHRRDIRRFRKTKSMDWDAFFARRAELFELNDEVRVAAAMQEAPVRREVDDQIAARIEARERREAGE